MRDLLHTIKGSNVVEGIDGRTQSSVKTEDLIIDKSGEGEVIEEVGKVFPNISVSIFA